VHSLFRALPKDKSQDRSNKNITVYRGQLEENVFDSLLPAIQSNALVIFPRSLLADFARLALKQVTTAVT
jgi:hypothetical protein